MKKFLTLLLVASLVINLFACGSSASNQASAQTQETETEIATETNDTKVAWKPERTVTFYLYSGTGGDTDTAMRALAADWTEKYGVQFNVVNMTGGAGGIAANFVYSQPSDGYTLFGMADGLSTINVLGAFDYPTSIWDIMLLFGGVGCVGVSKDSPYNSLEEVVNDAKAGKNIRLSVCSPGTIWHVDALQFDDALGTNFNVLTYDGSNQAIVGMLSGEADIVCSSLGEQSEYIKSGDIKPLAVLTNGSRTIDGYDGKIPAITELYPEEFANVTFARQWNGVGIKNDADESIKKFYEDAFVETTNSGRLDYVKEARNTEYINLIGDDAQKFVDNCNSACSWTIYDLGIAEISPEKFGIKRLE